MSDLKDIKPNEEKLLNSEAAGSRMVKGATILAVCGIICKVLGAVFRIPLTNLIGAEGMSYYGVVYPIYSLFLILSTAGFPVAISRMVSGRIALGDYKNAHRTFKISMYLMLAIGAVSFIICFFGAGAFAKAVGNPGAAMSLRAISPALLFAPVVASLRGYFQGQQNMTPTGVSQVFEQMIRVGVGLTLSFVLVKYSLEYASAGATFGASAGLMLALVVLAVIYSKGKAERAAKIQASDTEEEDRGSLIKELINIAIPITIGSSIMPLMMIIDSFVIMNRLQATGWSLAMSKTLYGLISGYCDPLVNFPVVFIDAISISLLPAVTAAFTLHNKEDLNKNVQAGIKTMMVVAYPCAIGLIVLARPILYMLYPTQLEEAELAVHSLQIFSIGIITLGTMRTFSSSLQGVGRMYLPVCNLFIGALAKIVISYTLVGIPALNINGAAIGSVSAYLIAALLNFRALRKYADVRIDVAGTFVKPLIASGIMGIVTYAVYRLLNNSMGHSAVAVLISMMVAVLVYFVLVFKTGTINREDAKLIPKGDLLMKLAEKAHLIK
ncbi:MAG: polysaccharide biosynthesis protein [Clostridiales bacterium]|nr:polysaccharide biosynthesis protein [Candidatus Crickella caballi]